MSEEMPIEGLNIDKGHKGEVELSEEFETVFKVATESIEESNEENIRDIRKKFKEIEEKIEKIKNENERIGYVEKTKVVTEGCNSVKELNDILNYIVEEIRKDIENQDIVVKEVEIKEEEPEKELSIIEAQESLDVALKYGDKDKIKKALEADPFGIKNNPMGREDHVVNVILEKYENELAELEDQAETVEIIKKKNILRNEISDTLIRRKSKELENLKKYLEKEEKEVVFEERHLKELKEDGKPEKILEIKKSEIERINKKILGMKDNINNVMAEIEDIKEKYKTQ